MPIILVLSSFVPEFQWLPPRPKQKHEICMYEYVLTFTMARIHWILSNSEFIKIRSRLHKNSWHSSCA